MSTPKLTVRQIETLRHVHDYMARNGMPPTIGDLVRLLGVKSDQGVIEILQRLEDRGMIERTPGQARGLRLTAEGCLMIGVPPPAGSSGLPQGAGRPFELSPVQQRIFKSLVDINAKLARMYEGGLRILLDDTNPERIPQSAHSMRESTMHLSSMGKSLLSKLEEKAAKDQRSSNARQLERVFDPQGGVIGFGRTVYDTWNEFQTFFVDVSHHRKEVTLDEYREKLAQFETLLSRYVLPHQVEIYTLLDELLDRGAEHADADELRALLSRNVESFRYFFRKMDARWLGYLQQNELVSPRWEVADYLARITPDVSDQVMAIIDDLKTDRNDWGTRKGLIDAAAKMPPNLARRIVDKIDCNGSQSFPPISSRYFPASFSDSFSVG
jgi:LexA DNA binding domain